MTDLPRENVQSYPRPPTLESVPQRIVIRLGGVLVADTMRRPITCHPRISQPPCARRRAAAFANGRALRTISTYGPGLQPPPARPGPMTHPPRALQRLLATWRSMPP
jgi:hypothetical protein